MVFQPTTLLYPDGLSYSLLGSKLGFVIFLVSSIGLIMLATYGIICKLRQDNNWKINNA